MDQIQPICDTAPKKRGRKPIYQSEEERRAAYLQRKAISGKKYYETHKKKAFQYQVTNRHRAALYRKLSSLIDTGCIPQYVIDVLIQHQIIEDPTCLATIKDNTEVNDAQQTANPTTTPAQE